MFKTLGMSNYCEFSVCAGPSRESVLRFPLYLEWAASSPSPNSKGYFWIYMIRNKWIPRSVHFSTACFISWIFSLAQFITYRCKHLSGNTSELSTGCRCWWLVGLISEKCTEQSQDKQTACSQERSLLLSKLFTRTGAHKHCGGSTGGLTSWQVL